MVCRPFGKAVPLKAAEVPRTLVVPDVVTTGSKEDGLIVKTPGLVPNTPGFELDSTLIRQALEGLWGIVTVSIPSLGVFAANTTEKLEPASVERMRLTLPITPLDDQVTD